MRKRANSRSVLRGELDNVGLPTLLTIIEMERRSGMLVVASGRRVARLYARDGNVIRAEVHNERGHGKRSGAEAVYEALSWCHGHFELWQQEIDGQDEVRVTNTFLLMEAARRTDESAGGAHISTELSTIIG